MTNRFAAFSSDFEKALGRERGHAFLRLLGEQERRVTRAEGLAESAVKPTEVGTPSVFGLTVGTNTYPSYANVISKLVTSGTLTSSLSPQTGILSLSGTGIASVAAGNGISVSTTSAIATVTATVASVAAGAGITVTPSGGTYTVASNLTTVAAGNGISVSTSSGTATVSANVAAVAAGSGISVSSSSGTVTVTSTSDLIHSFMASDWYPASTDGAGAVSTVTNSGGVDFQVCAFGTGDAYMCKMHTPPSNWNGTTVYLRVLWRIGSDATPISENRVFRWEAQCAGVKSGDTFDTPAYGTAVSSVDVQPATGDSFYQADIGPLNIGGSSSPKYLLFKLGRVATGVTLPWNVAFDCVSASIYYNTAPA